MIAASSASSFAILSPSLLHGPPHKPSFDIRKCHFSQSERHAMRAALAIGSKGDK